MAKVAKHTIKHGDDDKVTTFSPGDEVSDVDKELLEEWEAAGLVVDESDSSEEEADDNKSEREQKVETAKQQKQEQQEDS